MYSRVSGNEHGAPVMQHVKPAQCAANRYMSNATLDLQSRDG